MHRSDVDPDLRDPGSPRERFSHARATPMSSARARHSLKTIVVGVAAFGVVGAVALAAMAVSRGERSSPPAPRPAPVLTVARTVPVGFEPLGIAAGEGGVWVASGPADARGTVARIDPANNAVIARIALPTSGFSWVATGEGGVWVLLAEGGLEPAASQRSKLVRIDPRTNRVAAVVDVGPAATRPAPLTVADGAVWATNFATSTVSRIDPATNRVTARIRTTPQPQREERGHPSGIAVTPGAVWVMNHREGTLVRIDPRTGAIAASIPTQDGRVAAGAGSIWVASAGGITVDRIDPATNAVVATVSGCSETHDVAVRKNVVLVTGAAGVCLIDATTNGFSGSIPLSHGASMPFGVTFSDDTTAWVSDAGGRAVVRVHVTP